MIYDEENNGGNDYTTEFRQYDARIGRWKSNEPKPVAWESYYAAFRNNPITFSDLRQRGTHIENQIRAEHSISLRTHYGLIKDASGNYRGNPQSRILNNKGESLFFKTTTKIKLIAPDAGLWNDGQNNTIIEGTHVAPFKY